MSFVMGKVGQRLGLQGGTRLVGRARAQGTKGGTRQGQGLGELTKPLSAT